MIPYVARKGTSAARVSTGGSDKIRGTETNGTYRVGLCGLVDDAGHDRDLLAFPTRRSSDLRDREHTLHRPADADVVVAEHEGPVAPIHVHRIVRQGFGSARIGERGQRLR